MQNTHGCRVLEAAMYRAYPTHPTYALCNGLKIKHNSRDVTVSSERAGRKCCAHLNIDFLLMSLLGISVHVPTADSGARVLSIWAVL